MHDGGKPLESTHHAEDSVGAAAALVHLGLASVAAELAQLKQAQHMVCACDNIFSQSGHKHASLLALVDLQLVVVRRQQVIDVLIVELQAGRSKNCGPLQNDQCLSNFTSQAAAIRKQLCKSVL